MSRNSKKVTQPIDKDADINKLAYDNGEMYNAPGIGAIYRVPSIEDFHEIPSIEDFHDIPSIEDFHDIPSIEDMCEIPSIDEMGMGFLIATHELLTEFSQVRQSKQ